MIVSNTHKKTGVTGYIWLVMAMFCIVFAGPARRWIEVKVNPPSYSASAAFTKKIKDGNRDKRQFLNAITHADVQQSPDHSLDTSFLLTALVTFALLYFFTSSSRQLKYNTRQLVFAPVGPLYLRDHRLQV